MEWNHSSAFIKVFNAFVMLYEERFDCIYVDYTMNFMIFNKCICD